MPSADFSHAVRLDRSTLSQFQSHATSQGTWEISRGKTQNLLRVNARFIKHAPNADGGLRGHVPARPERTTPLIPAFGGIRRPALLDWASTRPHLAVTPLPFSLPSAPLIPGVRTSTSQALCHARHTRLKSAVAVSHPLE